MPKPTLPHYYQHCYLHSAWDMTCSTTLITNTLLTRDLYSWVQTAVQVYSECAVLFRFLGWVGTREHFDFYELCVVQLGEHCTHCSAWCTLYTLFRLVHTYYLCCLGWVMAHLGILPQPVGWAVVHSWVLPHLGSCVGWNRAHLGDLPCLSSDVGWTVSHS